MKVKLFSTIIVSVILLLLASAGPAHARSDRNRAPDFTLKDMNGKEVELAALRGKPVLLNFWATWCGYCRRERPHLNKLYNMYKDKGLVVLSVATDRSIEKVRRYLKEIPADFTVLLDVDGRVVSMYAIRGYPSSFLIGRDGTVKQAVVGFREWTNAASLRMIDKLIKEE